MTNMVIRPQLVKTTCKTVENSGKNR